MVSMRSYASLALCLLFVLHVLRDSSVHADQGKGMKGNGLTATSEGNGESLQKELVDGTAAAGDGTRGIGGRKMVVDKVMKKEEGQNEKTTMISGKDKNASKESLGGPHHPSNFQKNSKAEETETWKSEETEETEVMNLMRKDYKGMDKPHRKPPINNHKPTD